MTAASTSESVKPTSGPSKFLSQLEQAAMRHGHAEADANGIAGWVRRFILFHATQHAQEMGRAEVATCSNAAPAA